MSEKFNKWWNGDNLTKDSLYRKNSPAYWAWEGWIAGVKAEREACALVCEQPIDEIQITDDCSEIRYMDGKECAEAIRARNL